LLARRPFSSLLAEGRTGLRGFRAVKLGLNPDRAELDRRINARVESMFGRGLMEEARALFGGEDSAWYGETPRQGPYGSLGYPQAMAAVRGKIKKEEAIQETQTATRRYAKRQRTWFRREPDVQWFVGFGDDPTIQQDVFNYLAGVSIKPAPATAGAAKPHPGPAAQTT